MQLYEQIEKEFDKQFGYNIFELIDKNNFAILYDRQDENPASANQIKSFLKQSFIRFLENECERLEKSKKDTRISNGGYGSGGVAYARCTECGGQEDCDCEIYNQALSDTILYYQNMIKELQI